VNSGAKKKRETRINAEGHRDTEKRKRTGLKTGHYKVKMPGFPTQFVGTPINRGKARRYEGGRKGAASCATTRERKGEEE
jgi:hypothetical protein